jgi:ADP-heptose:LPS heptosyltransferase
MSKPLNEKPLEKSHILVIKLGALGDFIQATGPMRAIRQHHPDAKITLLTTKPFVTIAQKSAYFDEIWVDERPRAFQFKAWRAQKKKFNDGNFSRVYDLQNNDRTGVYFKLFHPKPEWVGVAKGASHRNTSPERTAGHAFDGHAQTLKLAGIDNVEIDTLEWAKGDISKFNLKNPFIILAAGSAPDRKEKRWPAKKYGALANKLVNAGYQPVLIGTMAEIDVNHTIRTICPDALDLTAKTQLFDIVELGRSAAAAIGNDTGPMHMIAPTTCPSLILFSRHSNPKRHVPKGQKVSLLYKEDIEELEIENVFDGLETLIKQG